MDDGPRGEVQVEGGPDTGLYASLRPDKVVVIGREGTLRLQDPTLSRRHAEIRWADGGYVLYDLGSRAGTFHNGTRVETASLSDGDFIQVGTHTLRFKMEPARREPPTVETAPPGSVSESDEEIPVATPSGPICMNCRKDIIPRPEPGAPAADSLYCHDCSDEFPLLGKVLANYRCERVLGSGGMGVVYRASHQTLGRPAAMKTLKGIAASDPVLVQRLLREATAAGRVRHPNIVEVLDTGEAGGVAYVAMELVEGPDLAAVLAKEERLAPARALSIAAQVAEALSAAFQQGYIHRDIKPENVLLLKGDRVKVTDFGLAKNLKEKAGEGLTQTGQVLGTLFYIAPEAIISSKDADQRADLYSLGATLYHLLAGRPPFNAREPIRLIMAIRKEEPPALGSLVPGLSAEVERVVTRSLRKDPAERYQTPDEMLADLRRAEASLRR